MTQMHNAWMRAVAGRLEMRYRYSKDIVHNNFVWPEGADFNAEAQRRREASTDYTDSHGSGDAAGLAGRDDPIAPQDPVNPVKKEPLRLCASALKNKNTVQEISAAAQAVLDARALYPSSSLADLYDPLTMPPELVKEHAHLDALVDRAYGLAPSSTDAKRVAHLFALYAEAVKKENAS